jgi:hypothetical protein
MKHCPIGGAAHKEFYVRLSPGIVQCLHSQCGKLFESRCPDKELASWKHPLTERPETQQGVNIDEVFIQDEPDNPDDLMARQEAMRIELTRRVNTNNYRRQDFREGAWLTGTTTTGTNITNVETNGDPTTEP